MMDESKTCSGENNNWVELTQEAGRNEIVFNNFRKFDITKLIVDGYPSNTSVDYLLTLKKEQDIDIFIDIWESIDQFMSPDNSIFYKGKKLTPATGRHVVNVSNYINFFGKDILNKEVCEIGAGWGGEMVVFNKLKKNYFPLNDGKNYSIFDLTSSIALIKKFAAANKVECNFRDVSNSKVVEYDLVISNGAFSEMGASLQEEYFEKIISKSNNGYFITNFDTHSKKMGGWSTNEFVDRLNSADKKNIQVLDIEKCVSKFESEAGNKLIVFGEVSMRGVRSRPVSSKILLLLLRVIDIIPRVTLKIKKILINKVL